jgi:predicted exporter
MAITRSCTSSRVHDWAVSGSARILALCLWLALLATAAVVVARAPYSTDLSAFLPRSPSPLQQLLVEQLRAGPASRLILIGIDGGSAQSRAHASSALARALRSQSAFSLIANGEAASGQREQQLAFAHRYQLSTRVTPERFSTAGLHAAIGASIDLLASPAGMLAQPLFQADPTGETLQVIDQFQGAAQPRIEQGVWSSKDGRRALLIAQTRAAGSDTDAQERAVALIRGAFARGAAADAEPMSAGAAPLSLVLSGPGVLSVQARASIKGEAIRLSLLSSALIVALLLAVYRSLPALLLGLLPVVSGALAGVAAVALGFGVVYGITLGFGVTLIGESVDYPIYFFIQALGRARQSGAGDAATTATTQRLLWPIIGLGALTSICGFAALLSSAFAGLAQLGLYSVTGLIVAAAVTRWVLPVLLPADLVIADLTRFGAWLQRLLARVRLHWSIALLFALICVGAIHLHRHQLWNRELAALSPIPLAAEALDAQMRADLGAPDVSNLVIVSGTSEEAVLEQSEQVGRRLEQLAADQVIGGYDSPAHYLPSLEAQRERQAALPDTLQLRARLAQAVTGLPLSAATLAPFVEQVEAARSAPPVTRATLDDTALALAVDGLLWREPDRWQALLPLRAPNGSGRDIDLKRVRATLADLAPRGVQVFNLKRETDRLYDDYLSAAAHQSLYGLGAIVLLLAIALRSARRVIRVLAPLLLSVLAVTASFAVSGGGLTIMHLIGMLLIVAVGSNYALFFDRGAVEGDRMPLQRMLASLVVANTSTVIAFGVLASSSVPVLNALGRTVAPGTLLALVFAALLAPRTLSRISGSKAA